MNVLNRAPTERVKPCSVQCVVRVRSRTMLTAYRRVVMAIASLNDEERRRVLGAAAIICGEHPNYECK